jgi:vancomycin resistance protein YoaR
MAKTKNKTVELFKSNKFKVVFTFFCILLGIPSFLILSYYFTFYQRIYPNVMVANVPVAGLTRDEAEAYLAKNIKTPTTVPLTYNGRDFSVDTSSLNLNYDFKKSADFAFSRGRTSYYFADLIKNPVLFLLNKTTVPLSLSFDDDSLRSQVSTIAFTVNKNAKKPSINYSNGSFNIDPGVAGEFVNQENLANEIVKNLSLNNSTQITIKTEFDDVTLNQAQENILRERAEKLLDKTLLLSFEDNTVSVSKNDLFKLLGAKGGADEEEIKSLVGFFSQKIERPAQNPIFVFDSGTVKEFLPAKNGIEVLREEFTSQIISAISSLENSEDKQITITPKIKITKPQYQTGDVNSLGIKELLGRGTSRFAGSITSRIHNINVASSKFRGVLVTPGETMSFNNILGDVSAETGYQQAYIIKEGATILGDGGGVCQVSTTLFRAALKAGLPIVERRAHAYRVGYYEQDSPPGLDATVYSPSPDLKIKNDTPAHILIQTSVDNKAKVLTFEIYGTSDGRVAATSKPKITNITPAPEDLYIDDPGLPTGTVKQIDWKASGAKVSFRYTVTKGGETIYEKTFYSNYQPWQAKFLRGTGPVQ